MTKETQAQRAQRNDSVHTQVEQLDRDTYIMRMMGVLDRAGAVYIELSVRGSDFYLEDLDDQCGDAFLISSKWSVKSDLDLFDLDRAVEYKEQKAAEASRLLKLKAGALAKLTDEERQLLGL
jgi:hypothetical protein